MTPLRLYLFGSPRLEVEGQLVALDRRKTMALLAYLALSPRPQSRDSLATLFWPEYEQKIARGNLRRILSLLKRSLGGNWLDTEREQVALKRNEALWVDVGVFRDLLAACERHNHVSSEVCSACLPLLAEAVTLYQDDFLAGFTLLDSPEFDDWQLFQAEGLRRDLASALTRLAHAYAQQDEFKAALAYARRWLVLDPLHEPAHRCLMQLYTESGDRAAALRQYQECARLFQEELGLSPSEETTQLYKTIKAMGTEGQRSRGIEEQSKIQSPHNLPALRHNLPTQTTPFIGRETELAELAQLLAVPNIRLVTILGPGGMGKTRLALELAATQLDQFEHGIYFVRLGPLESPEGIIPALAEALQFSFYEGSTPEQQLHDYLREKQALLVMDNYEHLLEGVHVVVELLKAASGLKILATSRARLNVREEQCYSIKGIDFPDEALAGEIEQSSAVKLFRATAQRIHSDFALTAGDILAVARICRLVEGMPLGLILAASWVETLSLAEIAAELARSLDFLEGNWRDLPQRQQSLRAVFDHSWRLLTEQEQAAFQQMSVFRGGFTREAAEAVTGASLPILRTLVNKSLLQRTPTGRYEVHELVRQYAAEKLASQSQTLRVFDAVSDVQNRHSAYYCAFLQEREADLKGGRQPQALAEIEADGENIRAGWRWAVEQSDIERIEMALESLGIFYVGRGRFQEGEAVYRHSAAFLRAKGLENKRRILTRMLTWQGVFSRRLGRWKPAEQLYQESLALLDHPELAGQDTRLEKIFTLRQLGDITWYSDVESGRRLLEESLALCRATGDLWGMGDVLRELSRSSMVLGELGEAKRYAEESLAIRRDLDDRHGLASTLDILSWIAANQGQLEASEQFAREGYALRQEAGDPASIAKGLFNIGLALTSLGQFTEAQRTLEQDWAIANELGERHHLNSVNIWLARPTLHLGQYEQAGHLAQQALLLASESGLRSHRGDALLQLGQVKIAEGAYAEAEAVLMESLTICREVKHALKVGWTLGSLGIAIYGSGDLVRAQQYLVELLQMVSNLEIFEGLLEGFALATLLLTHQRKIEQAVEIYALASCYPYVANSRWFEDVAGRHIAAVTRTLPLEVVAAAQARGRARDLWATAVELLAKLERKSEI